MESVLWGEFEINGNEILEGGEKVKSIGNKSGSDISARLNQGQGLTSSLGSQSLDYIGII